MIIILSRDAELYSTRSLKEAFSRNGEEVKIIDALRLVVKIGRGVYLDGEEVCPKLVIPRFSAAILLAGLAAIREWERMGVPVLNSSAGLEVAHDQLRSLQRLSAAGIRVPESSFCSQPYGESTFELLIGEVPKVIKLLDGSQGNGVNLVHDYAGAKSLLSTLATLRSSGVIQRFYGEAQGCDYRIVMYRGVVLGAIRRIAAQGDFRANVHQGGRVERFEPSAEQVDLSHQAMLAVGVDFAGVDLIDTAEGSRVLEVNASPGFEGVEGGQFTSVTSMLAQVVADRILGAQ